MAPWLRLLAFTLSFTLAALAASEGAELKLGRGINILGYDGIWTGGVDAPFRMSDFPAIRRAGFQHVRINFFGLRYLDAQGRLDPAVLTRLDGVIDAASRAGLTPVLDQHDNRLCQEKPEACAAPLILFWRRIAAHYAGTRPELVYEILNEPGGAMSLAQWNGVLNQALQVIRADDPQRRVIVGALNRGEPHDVEALALPDDDRNLIVSVHYYEPMRFTHQGAPWIAALAKATPVEWGSAEDRARARADLAIAQTWANSHNRDVYLGEFGVYDKAPPQARAAWVGFMAKTAEEFGWSWAYWQFDHDFGLFDSRLHRWNDALLKALTP